MKSRNVPLVAASRVASPGTASPAALTPGAPLPGSRFPLGATVRDGGTDVVFNHTAEADHSGPTLCYRGLDNAAYYRLDPGDPRHYLDTTGCGNSLNVADPVTLQLILDSLRYWLTEMRVDGFRFDLAPTLARQEVPSTRGRRSSTWSRRIRSCPEPS